MAFLGDPKNSAAAKRSADVWRYSVHGCPREGPIDVLDERRSIRPCTVSAVERRQSAEGLRRRGNRDASADEKIKRVSNPEEGLVQESRQRS